MTRLRSMIAQTANDRIWFRQHGRQIEAAACAIREKALREALAAVEREIADA